MTLDQLDRHIKNYLTYLKQTNSLKGIGDITFKIKHSKKSKSIYVRIFVPVQKEIFIKTLRFSDHEYILHHAICKSYKGVIVEPDKEISKRMKKHIEATLRKEITRLIYGANLRMIYTFKADGH